MILISKILKLRTVLEDKTKHKSQGLLGDMDLD